MAGRKITLSDIREEALLARMPGRRGFLRRREPEIVALAIYGTMLLCWVGFMHDREITFSSPIPEPGDFDYLLGPAPPRAPPWAQELLFAACCSYLLAGLLVFFGAIFSGALAWARERDRGTLEPLLLTPMNFSAVASVRFWLVLWPWTKLMLYLLPLYVFISGSNLFTEAARSGPRALSIPSESLWEVCSQCMFMPKLVMALHACTRGSWRLGWYGNLGGGVLALARFANDFSIVMFVCAAAYFISGRARSGAVALAVSCLLVPVALYAVPVAAWLILPDFGFAGIVGFVSRVWLSFWLVGRVARNFNQYALGEKSAQ